MISKKNVTAHTSELILNPHLLLLCMMAFGLFYGKILSCQRNQFENKLKRPRERTAKVLQDGKTPAETKALIESLLTILEIVVVVLLEKKARKKLKQ